MQILPIDVTALVSAILGISIVLIPVLGLTARFALQPLVEALARLFEHKGLDDTVQLLDRRVSLLEQHLDSLDSTVRRLGEVQDFHRALGAGEERASARAKAGPE